MQRREQRREQRLPMVGSRNGRQGGALSGASQRGRRRAVHRARPPTSSQALFTAATARRQPLCETIIEGGSSHGPNTELGQYRRGPYPWESCAVRKLAGRIGRRDPAATPMMIEGREGTILSAVGDEADHRVATEVLKWHQARRKAEIADRRQVVNVAGDSRGVKSLALMPKARTLARQNQPSQPQGQRRAHGLEIATRRDSAKVFSFGAVYEHRDCFGIPRYVGQTELVPEEQFRLDIEHPGVRRTLRQPRTGKQGSSEVVWAGFGTGPVGAQQMADMRMAVQHVRAERVHAAKLSGFKPYSRHGAIGALTDQ